MKRSLAGKGKAEISYEKERIMNERRRVMGPRSNERIESAVKRWRNSSAQ